MPWLPKLKGGGPKPHALLKAAKHNERVKVDELVADLENNGIDINYTDDSGRTAMHWAANEGHLEVVESLLQAPGLNLELKTVQMARTALFLSVVQGHAEVAAALLRQGARVDARDYDHNTVLHAAADSGHARIMRLLLMDMQNKIEDPNAFMLLIDAADQKFGRTALHWAAYNGHSAVFTLLLEFGASTHSRDHDNKTPEDIAGTSKSARQGREYVLQELRRSINQVAQGMRTSRASTASGISTPRQPPHGSRHLNQSPAASLHSASERNSHSHSQSYLLDSYHAPLNTSVASTSASGSQAPPPGPSSYPPNPPPNFSNSLPPFGAQTPTYGNPLHSSNPHPFTQSLQLPPSYPDQNPQDLYDQPRMRPASTAASHATYPSEWRRSKSHSISSATITAARQPPLYPMDEAPLQPMGAQALPPTMGLQGLPPMGAQALRSSDIQRWADQASRSSGSNSGRGPPSDPPQQQGRGSSNGMQATGGGLGPAMGGPAAMQAGQAPAFPGANATSTPGAIINAIFDVAAQLVRVCDEAVYCRYKSRRLKERTNDLTMCLQSLPDALPQHAARLQGAYEQTLRGLHQVLLNVKELVDRVNGRSENLFARTMEFLRSMGFREEFEILECELHSGTAQLLLILQVANLNAKVLPEQLPHWHQQNLDDRRQDLLELEQCILGVLCGLSQQGVQLGQAVQRLKDMLEANNLDLKQLVSWLDRMDARHVLLTSHLQQRVDDVAAMADSILSYLQPSQLQGGDSQRPPFLISIRTIRIDANPTLMGWGGFGMVVKAFRDRFGVVAIKIHNMNQVGDIDKEAAVREAVKLCRVNHHNVVRCFGIIADDPGLAGSLVMEWVDGGNMYMYLQGRQSWRVDVGVRIQLMLQAAAGLKHLHQQKLVHGDIKPQNILLQMPERGSNEDGMPVDGPPEAVVPLVKICDFGLAKYTATARLDSRGSTSSWSTAKYTPRYSSPERQTSMRRSFQDDVYAFGMLMYFAVTSEEPFGDCSHPDELRVGVGAGHRPDLDTWAEQQSTGDWATGANLYARLAKKCWDGNPAERPSFEEIYAELERMVWAPTEPLDP